MATKKQSAKPKLMAGADGAGIATTGDDEGSVWRRRLSAAKRQRDAHAGAWEENKRLLIGGKGVRGLKKEGAVALAWAAFQTMVGQVFAQTPKPIIREQQSKMAEVAKLLTQVVEDDLEAMSIRHATRLAIMDVFWAGFGVVVEKMHSDCTALTYRFTDAAGEEYEGDKPEDEAAELLQPTSQRYSIYRVHPEAVLFDPVGTWPDLRDHRWISLEFYPTISELRSDDTFTISAETLKSLPRLKASPALDPTPYGTSGNRVAWTESTDNSDDDQVRIYEIWDRLEEKKLYMPAGSDKIIGKEDWPVVLKYNGETQFPVSVLYFNENPDEFWPIPELTMVADHIKQYSVLFRQILLDAVTKWRKIAIQGGVLQKGHEARLEAGSARSVISIDNTKFAGPQSDIDIRKIIAPIPDPNVQGDVVSVLGMVKQLVHEVIGAGDFASAGFRSTRSATEAAALSDFLKTRMSNRTENLDAFFKHVVMIHALYLQNTLTETRSAQITDSQGMSVWKQYSKDQLQGDFRFSIYAGSSMPKNTETYRQECLAWFQQVAPLVQQSGGSLMPLIQWIAPFYHVPQQLLDNMFNNHKQALQQLALMFAMAHQGAKVPGAQMMDTIAAAINTGLTQTEIQQVTQNAASQVAATQQPGGLPGTNPADQTK